MCAWTASLDGNIAQVLNVRPGDGRYAVQEVAAGEAPAGVVTIIAVVHNRQGPVDGDGLAVDLETGEEEVVFGVDGAENASSAGGWDNTDVERGIEGQIDLRASEGLAVNLVANLGGKLEEGRLAVSPVTRGVAVVVVRHVA